MGIILYILTENYCSIKLLKEKQFCVVIVLSKRSEPTIF